MIKFIAYHTGYAENCSTSLMVYQCQFFGNPGYESPRQAFLDFTEDIYSKFIDDVLSFRIPTNECCKTFSLLGSSVDGSMEWQEKYRVCDKCGMELKEKQFNMDEFMDYFSNLRMDTCDSYGEAEATSTRSLTWFPFWTDRFIGAPKEEIIYIDEYAEVALGQALLEIHPELKSSSDEDWILDSTWEALKNDMPPKI